MSRKTFRAACGCEIHIIKWNSKTDMASVKNCSLHKAADELLAALKAWEHWYSVDSTEFNRDTARDKGLDAIRKAEEKPCR